jgi:Flp pilus assembly protein TadD
MGTRGAILVETGRVAEGEELLRRAHRMHRDRFSRASNLACLAIAAARGGDRGGAERLLERARKLDAECDALLRAERVLAATAT